MDAIRRITANLPAELLRDAQKTTGQGITETLIEGLRLLKRSNALKKAKALQGKIKLEVDLTESRERSNR